MKYCPKLTFPVFATWCGPCKAIAPLYEQLALQLSRPNIITFTKIDVDKAQDIAKAYEVSAYVGKLPVMAER